MQNKTHPSCNFAGLEEKKFFSLFLRRCCFCTMCSQFKAGSFPAKSDTRKCSFSPRSLPAVLAPLQDSSVCSSVLSSPADAPQPVPPAAAWLLLAFPPCPQHSCLKAPLFTLRAQSQSCCQPSLLRCFLPSAGDISVTRAGSSLRQACRPGMRAKWKGS